MELANLDAYLAYRPWRPECREAYEQAIQAGRIASDDGAVIAGQFVDRVLSTFSDEADRRRLIFSYLGTGVPHPHQIKENEQ